VLNLRGREKGEKPGKKRAWTMGEYREFNISTVPRGGRQIAKVKNAKLAWNRKGKKKKNRSSRVSNKRGKRVDSAY